MNENQPQNSLSLQATEKRVSLIEKKFVKRILSINPGLGEKAMQVAHDLCDCGLSPSMSAMLIDSVYSPTDIQGRGQTNRAQWFNQAVTRRYSGRIDRIRTDISAFRSFLADMEEAVEMRDILNGEGFTFSFEETFALWELGLNAESVLAMLWNLVETYSQIRAKKIITSAARSVTLGHFQQLETAIESISYGYEYERIRD